MKVIAAIERRPDFLWVRRIKHHLFKVHHPIEGVAGSNPLIQSLPLCFLLGAEDARDGGGVAEGSLRRAKNLHAAVMCPLDELLHAGYQIIHANGFRGGRHRRAWKPDVDDALKNDDVLDARLIERVVIKASQPVYAEFRSNLRRIMKNPVTYDPRVQHPERNALL